jgi:hypothetical protein
MIGRRLIAMSIAFAAFCLHTYGQPSPGGRVRVRFAPVIDGRELHLDSPVTQDLRITMLRCYVSGIALCRDGKEVWREADSYHLLDAEQPESLTLDLNPPAAVQYNSIRFNLGIDSAVSCSGAHGGDLDPVKGMYWAWQSGYINFKLEGVSSRSVARKHQFQFHLGGYRYPYSSIQHVALTVRPSPEMIIRMDLAKFLAGIDLSKQNSVMIPGAEAVALSQKAADIFEMP